jgi:hypothetical protein
VQLTKDGYEPLLTTGEAKAPWWDIIPLDLASEAWPGEPHTDIQWTYNLQPREHDRPGLIDRAQALREKLLTEAPIPPGTPTSQTMPATTAPAAATPSPAASQPASEAGATATSSPQPASQPN